MNRRLGENRSGRSRNKEEELAEINACRRKMGLPELVMKKRKCLNCGKEFSSDSFRVCVECMREHRTSGFSAWD
jgi:predicted Zn-ribbon and HTH transcriptional regulator